MEFLDRYGDGVSTNVPQVVLNGHCERVRAAHYASGDPFRLLERRHSLAEIVGRGAVVIPERPRVIPPHREREFITLVPRTPPPALVVSLVCYRPLDNFCASAWDRRG